MHRNRPRLTNSSIFQPENHTLPPCTHGSHHERIVPYRLRSQEMEEGMGQVLRSPLQHSTVNRHHWSLIFRRRNPRQPPRHVFRQRVDATDDILPHANPLHQSIRVRARPDNRIAPARTLNNKIEEILGPEVQDLHANPGMWDLLLHMLLCPT